MTRTVGGGAPVAQLRHRQPEQFADRAADLPDVDAVVEPDRGLAGDRADKPHDVH